MSFSEEVKAELQKSIIIQEIFEFPQTEILNVVFGESPSAESTRLKTFMKNLFLVFGTISDPAVEYHLEIRTPSPEHSDVLAYGLFHCGFKVKKGARNAPKRHKTFVYIKDGDSIADFLTFIGAEKFALRLIEEKIMKELRSNANRATNCNVANIEKAARASAEQLHYISVLREHKIIDMLSDDMLKLIKIRQENHEYTLSDLSEESGMPKSKVYRLLKKIEKMARALS